MNNPRVERLAVFGTMYAQPVEYKYTVPGLECLETYPLVWQLPVESVSCSGLVTTQDNPQVTALDNGLPV